MIETTHRIAALLCSIACGLGVSTTAGAGNDIAGTQPSQRPQSAPVLNSVHKDAAWYNRSLTGISQPYPHSLRFLEDQGNWHTPFNHPGMTPPYDIRGWHAR